MATITQLIDLQDRESIVFEIKSQILEAVRDAFPENDIGDVSIELTTPTDAKFGDYSSNIALKISKNVGKNPKEVAELVKSSLLNSEFSSEKGNIEFEKVEIAGPGFINLTLKSDLFVQNIQRIIEEGDDYGKWNLTSDQVMVEFGQPNTHKAFHVGHLKSSITGLAVVNLLQNLGFNVVKANFFGDIGMHVAKTIWGFKQKGEPEGFRNLDPHSRMKYIDECYAFASRQFKDDPDAEKAIREINKKIYDKSDDEIEKIYLATKEWSLEHLNAAFKMLGVVYDRQYPESEVANIGLAKVNEFFGRIFTKDDRAIIFDGEEYKVGKRVFITSEGNPTYGAKDLGLAYKKFDEYPDLAFNITTTSVEQRNYFLSVIKALELTNDKFINRYFNVNFGWMLRGGKKFSSRMGESIKGMDVIQEAKDFAAKRIAETKSYSEEESAEISEKTAIAGLKFLILSHEMHTDINYDPEEFLNPEGFSGPYILYAYVRAKSILRQAQKSNDKLSSDAKLDESELELAKLLSRFHQVTLDAGKNLAPHLVANYIFEVAQTFNSFYKNNKVIGDPNEQFRLKLVEAVSIVLRNGLNLLGIETIEKM